MSKTTNIPLWSGLWSAKTLKDKQRTNSRHINHRIMICISFILMVSETVSFEEEALVEEIHGRRNSNNSWTQQSLFYVIMERTFPFYSDSFAGGKKESSSIDKVIAFCFVALHKIIMNIRISIKSKRTSNSNARRNWRRWPLHLLIPSLGNTFQ